MKPLPKTSLVALLILAVAAALRVQNLALRPFHHDEGVNGFFLARLVREGIFNYDPSNYHGPTLYYLTLPLAAILGLSDAAVRGTTALFGIFVIFLLWRLLAPLGAMYAFGAMALFATSPGAIFYSRYFIHEMLFVAFTVGALATSPRPDCTARWRFIATGTFLALLFATKETAFVSVGAMIGGAVVAAWAVLGLSPLAVLRGIKPYAREHADSLLHGFIAFVVTAGYLFHEIGALRFLGGRVSLVPVAAALLGLSAGLSAVKSQDLETRKYDDEAHPYIYAHTQRSFLEFVRLVEEKAKGLAGTETGIAVFAPENWPLAWYLRDYTKTGYWGDIKPEVDVDMYIVSAGQDAQMAMNTRGRYDRFGPYNLRGVVDLVLYVRRTPR